MNMNDQPSFYHNNMNQKWFGCGFDLGTVKALPERIAEDHRHNGGMAKTNLAEIKTAAR